VSAAYYVTTPIYYANAEPHIGHTYSNLVADTLVRWHRMHGRDAFWVSGTDEYGEKMVEAAAKAGTPPAAFTERISAIHKRTFAELGIAADRFVRTTDPGHVADVTRILQQVYDAGWIELREYEGLYCVGCERFLTERDMVDGLCRDHERAPEPRRETNYFFLMSREFAWLRGWIESHPDFIRPVRYRNEILAMLRDESGLGDLSISRPKSRLDWGIELPFDRDHVCYVWFDALITYLSGIGYPGDPRFAERWGASEHVIGKDILKPHGIFWPIMLKAIGLAPYQNLSVHGFWNVDERKVSKSLGNMISPIAMRDRYGFEAFRYFLLREMSFGLDASFSEEALVERVNADLANNLGNLVSRTLNLVEKLCGGAVPAPAAEGEAERGVAAAADRAAAAVDAAMADLRFHEAIAAILAFSSDVNRYLDGLAPWKAAKQPGGEAVVATSLATTCRALRSIAVLLAPFLPQTAQEIAGRLGLPDLLRDARLPSGAALAAEPKTGTRIARGGPLFPRAELPAEPS
jgi:methionyl-tRNA synthetase